MTAPPDPKTQTTSALLRRTANEIDSMVSAGLVFDPGGELCGVAIELRVRATRIELENEVSNGVLRRLPTSATAAARVDTIKFIDQPAPEETNGNDSDPTE